MTATQSTMPTKYLVQRTLARICTRLEEGASSYQIGLELEAEDIPRDVTAGLVSKIRTGLQERQAQGVRNQIYGSLWFSGGLIVSMVSMASDSGGVLAIGAIFWGRGPSPRWFLPKTSDYLVMHPQLECAA